jgi:hypothetical protein
MAEQRRIGEHGNSPRKLAEHQHGVHHGVVVVGRHQQRPTRGDPLGTDDVDATIEQPQEQSDDA